MRIHIGTKSPVKIEAIVGLSKEYAFLREAKFESFKINSGISDQPMTLEDTISGAENRAKRSLKGADLSFGIESGLMAVPKTKTGYMNITVCAIYDGFDIYLGLSSLFEYPKKVTQITVEEGIEISEAFKKSGLTQSEKIGYAEGGIGFMTNGRIHSIEYYRQAARIAIAHFENRSMLL